jgi:hypothetical protein
VVDEVPTLSAEVGAGSCCGIFVRPWASFQRGCELICGTVLLTSVGQGNRSSWQGRGMMPRIIDGLQVVISRVPRGSVFLGHVYARARSFAPSCREGGKAAKLACDSPCTSAGIPVVAFLRSFYNEPDVGLVYKLLGWKRLLNFNGSSEYQYLVSETSRLALSLDILLDGFGGPDTATEV